MILRMKKTRLPVRRETIRSLNVLHLVQVVGGDDQPFASGDKICPFASGDKICPAPGAVPTVGC
jgi:hypothetical protein